MVSEGRHVAYAHGCDLEARGALRPLCSSITHHSLGGRTCSPWQAELIVMELVGQVADGHVGTAHRLAARHHGRDMSQTPHGDRASTRVRPECRPTTPTSADEPVETVGRAGRWVVVGSRSRQGGRTGEDRSG